MRFPKSVISQLWSQFPSFLALLKESVFPENIVPTNIRKQQGKIVWLEGQLSVCG